MYLVIRICRDKDHIPYRGTIMQQGNAAPGLKRTLGTFHLWGIAVGLVISGEYFGWSYGWAQAGTLGFMVTAPAVSVCAVANKIPKSSFSSICNNLA